MASTTRPMRSSKMASVSSTCRFGPIERNLCPPQVGRVSGRALVTCRRCRVLSAPRTMPRIAVTAVLWWASSSSRCARRLAAASPITVASPAASGASCSWRSALRNRDFICSVTGPKRGSLAHRKIFFASESKAPRAKVSLAVAAASASLVAPACARAASPSPTHAISPSRATAAAPDAETALVADDEAARAQAGATKDALAAATAKDTLARGAFDSDAKKIFLWANDPRFGPVTEQMKSRFRSADLQEQLAPEAAGLATVMGEAAASLRAHLDELDAHQRTAVTAMRGMVRGALKTLHRLQVTSALPDTLPTWGGQRFLSIGPKRHVELTDAILDDRIGRVVDAMCTAGNEIPKGADLLWAATHLSLIHISEPTRRTPISYAVFCLKKKNPTAEGLALAGQMGRTVKHGLRAKNHR